MFFLTTPRHESSLDRKIPLKANCYFAMHTVYELKRIDSDYFGESQMKSLER